ncbi:MAG: hypothetical protein CL911_01445, partial [Deltaproteobacteria bacterium]|nr:hypothetical protein [Deltaproteobacteria bacterium]
YEPGQFTPVYVATMKDKHQAGGRADAASRPCCGQFDDPAAIEQQLPIASGQIESSHRHLIQKRLKLPGGLVETGACRLHARSQGCPKNQRWSHSVSSPHRSD